MFAKITEIFVNIIKSFYETLFAMAPYLLLGFFVAGLLSIFLPASFVERHLGGRGIWQVVKSSLLGVPLPLCSCGVIPVAASLRRHGASRGAVAAFLLSTPQTGIDSIMVTYSLLGPVMAIFRPIAAFLSGMVGGILVNTGDGIKTDATNEKCSDECCSLTGENITVKGKIIKAFKHGFVTLPADLAGSIMAGLLIAGLINAVVPDNFFTGTAIHGFSGMFLMMLVGIPIYVCATGSVPIAAMMIAKGISPGAALVFLMTGPATNSATIAAVWKMLGKKAAFLYLAAVAGTALLSGIILDHFFLLSGARNVLHHATHFMLPPVVEILSAIILLLVLLSSDIIKRKKN